MCTILKKDSLIQNILSAFSKVLGANIYTTDQSLFLILHYRLIPPSPFSWFWRLLILEIEPFAFDSFYGSAILQFRLVPIFLLACKQTCTLWYLYSLIFVLSVTCTLWYLYSLIFVCTLWYLVFRFFIQKFFV